LIVSPYFVPGDAGVAWLSGLVTQGVQVTVLTNSLAASDVSAVHAGYKRYRKALVAAGVRLYELRPDAAPGGLRKAAKGSLSGSRASLHAKTFIFDRRAVFIGSLNLDPRSVGLNTEIGVVCQSVPMAEAMHDAIERHIDQNAWRLALDPDAHGTAQLVWVETGPDGVRRLGEEPQVSAWRKFSVWFLGLLPIESQL
jgi:putative cardiolipin synthase